MCVARVAGHVRGSVGSLAVLHGSCLDARKPSLVPGNQCPALPACLLCSEWYSRIPVSSRWGEGRALVVMCRPLDAFVLQPTAPSRGINPDGCAAQQQRPLPLGGSGEAGQPKGQLVGTNDLCSDALAQCCCCIVPPCCAVD